VIVYVDFEHHRLRHHNPDLWRFFAAKTLEIKYRLEAISGKKCLIVHYKHVNPALLHELNVRAVVVSGHYTAFQYYSETDLAGLRTIYRQAAWPILGFCAGFQRMAETYGATVAPIKSKMLPDTSLPLGISSKPSNMLSQDTQQEYGFMPVQVVKQHPLFNGLSNESIFYQLHSWEVKSAPEAFQLLAKSSLCSVQAIAHKNAPLFGMQFHAEQYDETHPDGLKILENFFRIAKY